MPSAAGRNLAHSMIFFSLVLFLYLSPDMLSARRFWSEAL